MKAKLKTDEPVVFTKKGIRRYPNREKFFEQLLSFRGRIKLEKGETIKDLVNAGRKY